MMIKPVKLESEKYPGRHVMHTEEPAAEPSLRAQQPKCLLWFISQMYARLLASVPYAAPLVSLAQPLLPPSFQDAVTLYI